MGKYYVMQKGQREWNKDEMRSYLDWDTAENLQVEARVEREMAIQPFSARRGMDDIWEAAARDVIDQMDHIA
jgi:hypothetical protein